MIIVAIFVIGFGNISPHLLRMASLHSANISCACFLLTGGIYFYCNAFSETKKRLLMLSLGSLFITLAIGTRIHYMLILPIIIFLIIREINNLNKDTIWKTKAIRILMIPIIVGSIFYMTYNYLRFNNPFETGRRYQLFHSQHRDARKTPPKLMRIKPERFPKGMYVIFLCPPKFNSTFPFVHLHLYWQANLKGVYPNYIPLEETAGIFFATPFTILLVLYPIIFILCKFLKHNNPLTIAKENTFPYYEFILVMSPAILFSLLLCLLSGVAFRYQGDYATFLILGTCVIWFFYDNVFSNQILLRRIMNTLTIFLAFLSIIFGTAFYIDQRNDHFYIANPKLYEKLERLALPISQAIEFIERLFIKSNELKILTSNNEYFSPFSPQKGQLLVRDNRDTILWFSGKLWHVLRDRNNKYSKSADYTMEVTFTRSFQGEIEPLLSLGIPEKADIFYVKYISNRKAIFGIDHWNHAPIESRPVYIKKDKKYKIELNCTNNKKKATFISIDNQRILTTDVECYPSDDLDIKIGINDKGGTICGYQFSGDINKVERLGLFE
ncbi:MAG: hypothetical protein HYZ79_09060 [Candidatus Melainabacteria bacterium]|nr:hypothetical protein [Candidatus Melainabacteria bacterium]